jgi:bifunctional DNase/RNase
MPRLPRVLLLMASTACAAQAPASDPVVSVAGDQAAAVVSPAPAARSKAERATRPEGYVELAVGGIVVTPRGPAVILTDPERAIVIPIFIGDGEALTIDLRRNRRRYARPLTHDLLDELMRRLGGVPVKIHIDDIRNDTFIGSIFVRRGSDVIEIDARPSDAIAMAVGHRIPIFVADHVLARAGIRKDEIVPNRSKRDGAPEEI